MAKIKYLIIHCTATPEGREVSVKELMSWFTAPKPQGNGWSKPGYRTVIHIDGKSSDLVEYNNNGVLEWSEVTYGARGFNSESIHISYVGGTQKHNIRVPKDTRTPQQKVTLESHVHSIISYHPDILVLGHNEVNPNKACPSFNVASWLKEIGVQDKNIFEYTTQASALILTGIPDEGMFDFTQRNIH